MFSSSILILNEFKMTFYKIFRIRYTRFKPFSTTHVEYYYKLDLPWLLISHCTLYVLMSGPTFTFSQ